MFAWITTDAAKGVGLLSKRYTPITYSHFEVLIDDTIVMSTAMVTSLITH